MGAMVAVVMIVAGVIGGVVGEAMRRRLNRLEYRLRFGPVDVPGLVSGGIGETDHDASEQPVSQDDRVLVSVGIGGIDHDPPDTSRPGSTVEESDPGDGAVDETLLPPPGSRIWMPVVLGLIWAGIVWGVSGSGGPGGLTAWVELLTWLAFSAVGLWLSVVDLDVQRLPDRAQLVLAAIVVVGGGLVWWTEPTRWAVGLGAALACGACFLVVHLFSRGGLGLGDVKLVMTCAWWLALTSVTSVVAAIAAACVLGLAYCLITRTRQFAFGPWLVAGSLIAGLLT